MEHIYRIEGMTCNHCKASVEKAVNAIEGVESAIAFPTENKVIVIGTAEEKKIEEAITVLGYSFKGKWQN